MICGNEFPSHYCSFTSGNRCPICSHGIITKEKCRQIFEKSGAFQLLEYRGLGGKTKHIVRHNCNYEWEVNYDSFILNEGCPRCSRNAVITEEQCC